MALPNVFEENTTNNLIERIDKLSPEIQPQWGKMDASKMLAHCNVTYEMAYEPEKHKKPNMLMGWMLKSFVKPKVVSEAPYAKNGPTAPAFIIKSEKDFDTEKNRLIDNIKKTQQLGSAYFNGKESHSFGKLNTEEWNNMFYKHLDHHLNQFGV